jgi:hypothetical protein
VRGGALSDVALRRFVRWRGLTDFAFMGGNSYPTRSPATERGEARMRVCRAP